MLFLHYTNNSVTEHKKNVHEVLTFFGFLHQPDCLRYDLSGHPVYQHQFGRKKLFCTNYSPIEG